MSFKFSNRIGKQNNFKDIPLAIAFSETLKTESISCISELAEAGLDSIFKDNLVKDIPILSTAISLYKITDSLKDRHNLKKMLIFLDEINRKIVSEEKRLEYCEKFKNNTTFKNQEIEYLLVLLDRYISYDKPQLLAKIYMAYLDNILTWEEVIRYAEVLDQLIYGDIDMLKRGTQCDVNAEKVPDSLIRLTSLGLMVELEQSINAPTTCGSITIPAATQKDYAPTGFGAKLIAILN